ncbi:hypothetical protein LEAN103870_19590 [Legionella anisa]|uniref:Uncharacterized protein n=1 Tax=Legionella anisa TaxID=28082 RepID=A0AAX0WZ40_9GAMM|nr:hypothetical protein [Legionella anisa]AWN73477.1 hypothetical protein DLD14_06270 [Legionella anisa]KTC70779.1 hypothetical protein Lani_2326 [Legionella anisa]MCW8426350.1 hypothetical protein [Legionella anisa]MCW8448010.1 hypothetical protein [Legionella anisa]PNL62611.1 hypothetical protein A6J39_016125 [Legionella anisa]
MFGKFFSYFTFFPAKVTPKGDPTHNNVTHFALLALMKQIETTYKNTQITLNEEKLNIWGQSDVLNWHRRFIANQKELFAAMDKVDLSCLITNSIYNDTVRNWIHGLYKVQPRAEETLVQYSMRAANESWMYKEKFDEFKSSWETSNANLIKANALKEIKILIETNIEKEKLTNKNKSEELKHLYEIYQQCVQMDTSNNPTQLFDKIHSILIAFIKDYLKSNNDSIKEFIFAQNQGHAANLIN